MRVEMPDLAAVARMRALQEKLKFPSGTATARVIRMLHGVPAGAPPEPDQAHRGHLLPVLEEVRWGSAACHQCCLTCPSGGGAAVSVALSSLPARAAARGRGGSHHAGAMCRWAHLQGGGSTLQEWALLLTVGQTSALGTGTLWAAGSKSGAGHGPLCAAGWEH